MKKLLFAGLVFLFFCRISYCQTQSKKDTVVTLSTQFGEMVILLYDRTPLHKHNFIRLINTGFYNGTKFHRIIKDFMIQGGDPNSKDSIPDNDGLGGPGYTIPAEIIPELSHKSGALAAARQGDNVNPLKASSGSQFYIVENKSGTPHLDKAYTVFGQVVKGIEIVEEIARQEKNFRDKPIADIPITMNTKVMKRKKIIKKYKCKDFYKS